MAAPAYRNVADAIRADIAGRRLVEGDRLPTVRELAERFDVPVGTVSRAIDLLRAEGVVVSRHGRGLYVRTFSRVRRTSPQRLHRQHWGQGRSIQDADTHGRMRVEHVEVTEVPAPATVAEALAITEGAAVLTRSRRFAIDDRVVQTAISYLPLDVVAAAPAVAYTGPGPGGIYARMAEAGLAPVKFTENIVCRMPTQQEATELDLPTGTPVIAITRHAHIATGRCIEINQMLLDASAYDLEYHFTADS
ncbi:GntR family transcriptional regulator [Nocardia panacis]|uniref:GntR family transcriptional regulator n=1 Tax=Nocardia panacis TaxID=2340916 RepID=A0A3A4KHW2_9NOCA|nr:GntR family transcriptional regulator [Nocardia panacis]RJO74196.1 GntR family transcriptional regulator [Nocardia panacis]